MSQDFLQRVEQRQREFERQDADLAAQEEGVRRKRAQLQNEINKLKASIEVYRELMDVTPEATPDVGLFEPSQPLGSVADMAAAIMTREGGSATILAIRDELARAGKVKPGTPGYGTVYAILSRSPRFERVDASTYRLRTTDATVH